MKFKIDFYTKPNGLKLSHKDSIVSLGSCFSEEMANRLKYSGFKVSNNLFGTLFHPEAILNVIASSINDSDDVAVVQRDDLFFSWDGSSKLYSTSKVEIQQIVIDRRKELKKALTQASVLIVTFGSSWKYVENNLKLTVGNCHKLPSDFFTKELSSIKEMINSWDKLLGELKLLNPRLKILFSVSPVRHKKNGLVENNRSKARLLEFVHYFVDAKKADYFPAYEILIDELRDYRFYENDLVHPNKDAVNYIWKAFKMTSIDIESLKLLDEFVQIKQLLSHKSLHPDSLKDKKRLADAKHRLSIFLKKNPCIVLH